MQNPSALSSCSIAYASRTWYVVHLALFNYVLTAFCCAQVDFLKTLSDECAPALTAVSFADSRGKLLTERCLSDLPRVPSSLQHIAWDVGGTRYLYKVTNQDARKSRAVLVSSLPRLQRKLWVDEAVLEHFGAERQCWQV